MIDYKNITVCPSTLQQGFSTYSPLALRYLFNRKEVPHSLKYKRFGNIKDEQYLIDKKTRISISGVQEKYSLKLIGKELEITDKAGEYILKPIPHTLLNVDQVPANEHLTMQIAEQVFNIDTAKNGLIFFSDGEMAYITKRFDVMPNGRRSLKEDFASLAGKTVEDFGSDFKYKGSYLEMANLIDKHISTAIVTKERLFALAIFNYLISNGDAHLKNFSVIDYEQNGVYQLAPAYDLLCTRLHIEDGDFALEDRLYDGDYLYESYAKYGFYGYDDFYRLGEMFKMRPQRIEHYLNLFTSKKEQVEDLVSRSFLNDEMRQLYLKHYYDKLGRLKTSYKKEYGVV
ncbi:MAG: HipA domain-containing protein [Chitinophagaceae bacterium]